MAKRVVRIPVSDLLIVGGDYGEITLRGGSEAARESIRAVAASVGCGSFQPRCDAEFCYDDTASPFIENRHAGREGPRLVDGTPNGASASEGGASPAAVEGDAERGP